ncbi:MAG TPA: hypothetical protein VKX28_19415 [Xanthobacteraceae bacterium]|nr:hypothetical protein [Xanthobacteraceae bacterium]
MILEFFALGTAVLPLDQEIASEKIADPMMVLSMNDERITARWRR